MLPDHQALPWHAANQIGRCHGQSGGNNHRCALQARHDGHSAAIRDEYTICDAVPSKTMPKPHDTQSRAFCRHIMLPAAMTTQTHIEAKYRQHSITQAMLGCQAAQNKTAKFCNGSFEPRGCACVVHPARHKAACIPSQASGCALHMATRGCKVRLRPSQWPKFKQTKLAHMVPQ